jgi:hypothetical protein
MMPEVFVLGSAKKVVEAKSVFFDYGSECREE